MTIPRASDRPLFTPGPLTTSLPVRQAMMRDFGSRDDGFIELVADIRRRLPRLGGVEAGPAWQTVLMQGSGTFGIESVLSTCLPADGHLLVLVNGAYGERMLQMAAVHRIRVSTLRWPEDQAVDPAEVARTLASDPSVTHVAVVHCETTTGLLNPVDEVGAVVREAGCLYLVDGMSAFGGVECSLEAMGADVLVSSSNKCIEGVPGFSFVLIRTPVLESCAGQARTLTLDLHAQWVGLQANGQFRFTPPTHALLAFHQALLELESEGGVAVREARYRENQTVLRDGLRAMGLQTYLPDALQGPIITSVLHPRDPAFCFAEFYRRLAGEGVVIYPGKLTRADCFRIGSIGRIFSADMRALLRLIDAVLREMGVQERGPRPEAGQGAG
jgi:2-aminoethylphosphonate-pyruvate transaminase